MTHHSWFSGLASLLAALAILAALVLACDVMPVSQPDSVLPDLPEAGEPIDLALGTATAQPGAMIGAPAGPTPSAGLTQTTAVAMKPAPTVAAPQRAFQERINILCLGLDNLDPNAAYRRSDTIIVVSLDPATKSVGMLSVPRDLYVPINGLTPPQRNRINAAFVFGDYYHYPGGGIALARRTVQETLGIPIHYYVAVDFRGFVKAIDALGGVDITLDKALSDPLTHWSFPAGPQRLNGEKALQFARVRYLDNDFQRERRQQMLLLALRNQALRLDILPRLPGLLTSLWGTFKTDMSAADILSLAPLAASVDISRIHNHIIDETMTTPYRTQAGAMVLLPKEDAIRKLVAEVLQKPPASVPVAGSPAAQVAAPPTATPAGDLARLQAEKARIEILNGTNTKGLAALTQSALRLLGYQITRIGDADRYTYANTVLTIYIDKSATRELLVQRFHIKAENVKVAINLKSAVDLRLTLGADAVP
jgi:LCP family protein required for cell wall assembly